MSYGTAQSDKTRKGFPRLIAWAVIPMGLLLVPFIAMQVTEEVQWKAADFALAGVLLAASGIIYALLTSKRKTALYRGTIALAVFIMLALIWAEFAVGVFG